MTTEPAQIGPRSHGAGNSNALQIDDDGDGYGVGSPKGPDADDQDPEVNTTASVLARYGSIEKFLEHKGLKPARIFYLATNGDDSHAGSGHPDRPYRTFARVAPALGPGDLVLFAAGTYKSDHSPAIDLNGTHGKKDKPVVIMAVPGSRVVLEAPSTAFSLQACTHLVLEGFVIDRADPGGGDGIRMV